LKTGRKQFTAAFKAKIALEAVKGARSINEVAGLYQVHPAQVAAWKKRLVEGAAELLADGRRKRGGSDGEAAVWRFLETLLGGILVSSATLALGYAAIVLSALAAAFGACRFRSMHKRIAAARRPKDMSQWAPRRSHASGSGVA